MKKPNRKSSNGSELSKSTNAPSWPNVPTVDTLQLKELLDRLQIRDWDYLVVGDGSGSTWGRECGWAAYCVERSSGKVEPFVGYANRGTVNVAEILALQFPLMELAAREAERLEKDGERRRAYQVYLITDSQYVQKMGDSNNRLPLKNASLWSHFDTFVRMGLVLHWRWIRRGTHPLHELADTLSKLARTQGVKYNLSKEGTRAAREHGPGESGTTGNVATQAEDD